MKTMHCHINNKQQHVPMKHIILASIDFKQDILDQDQPMPNDDKNFDYI